MIQDKKSFTNTIDQTVGSEQVSEIFLTKYKTLFNYRGISLSNSICKLYDYVFIDLHIDYLKTDDMQFRFKNNHSTVLCTAVYIETVNHYMNEGSDIYSCLIDPSKAFDWVHWGDFFSTLSEKKCLLYSLT